jgi:phosphoribosyl 1,2-cyclic phosphodiesterase
MSLFTASLNSGSNGNCYYIGNENEAVLVDAGISCRETEKRMKRLGLNIHKVKAIFISHEHSDHIKGLEVLSKKFEIPVFINEKTLKHGRLKLAKKLVHSFGHNTAIGIGELSVIPFIKRHDASDPYSFTICHHDVNIGVMTDIGSVCANVVDHFSKCHAVFLEANYDEDMLETGRYPIYLKKRIRGGMGHLSNTQALELFLKYRGPHLNHVFLSHLSRENNSPQVVEKLFKTHAGGAHVVVASRDYETSVYHIKHSALNTDRASVFAGKEAQMSLF